MQRNTSRETVAEKSPEHLQARAVPTSYPLLPQVTCNCYLDESRSPGRTSLASRPAEDRPRIGGRQTGTPQTKSHRTRSPVPEPAERRSRRQLPAVTESLALTPEGRPRATPTAGQEARGDERPGTRPPPGTCRRSPCAHTPLRDQPLRWHGEGFQPGAQFEF